MAPSEDLKDDSAEYQQVKQKMLSTIRPHKNNIGGVFTGYTIINIKRIKNEPMLSRFKSKQSQIIEKGAGSSEVQLFHGTRERNLGKILDSGFETDAADESGMFGAGTYFADLSSKSNQYTFSKRGCRRHKNRKCNECYRYLLLCRVELGKTYTATTVVDIKTLANYNSISAKPKPGFLQYPEYVISDPDQAYPEYLIKYIIKA